MGITMYAQRVGHAVKWRAEAKAKRAFAFWLVDGWIERRIGSYIRRYADAATTFLDVGCGTDLRLRDYLPTGVLYNGIDIEPGVVNVPAAREAGCSVQAADARQMPFPNGSFSVMTSMEMLYEIPDWRTVLDEMSRVLVPGGVVILSVPNGYCYKYAKKGPHPNRRSVCTFSEYATALRDAGFEIIESHMLGWWLPVLRHSRYSIMFPVASKNEFYNCNFFFVCKTPMGPEQSSAFPSQMAGVESPPQAPDRPPCRSRDDSRGL